MKMQPRQSQPATRSLRRSSAYGICTLKMLLLCAGDSGRVACALDGARMMMCDVEGLDIM
jgi:hypothetical protein